VCLSGTQVTKLNIDHQPRSLTYPLPSPLRAKTSAELEPAHENPTLNFQEFCGLAVKQILSKVKLYKFTMISGLLTTRSQNTLLPNYPTMTYALEVIYIYWIHMLEIAFSTLHSDTPGR